MKGYECSLARDFARAGARLFRKVEALRGVVVLGHGGRRDCGDGFVEAK
jgi:hypothetical protein